MDLEKTMVSFYDCSNLKSVIFPNDSQLREIGEVAIQGCDSLPRIAIPDSVTTIGATPFTCYLLTNRVFRKLEMVLFAIVHHFNP